ncbi:hypothetical protein ABB37_00545 [Leptomonas pyrrhocoris]|uniref:Uncharacterized protein n=1 Tax=Leptomonas pyrrhocoris TaxID=157538 RepID=A0A0N1J5H5_LEPPY|nr:hypothetical protein ABB37_00545 [Leptomonas pyrrhocoris]KPA86341.1 hypothetical protein ABB37_00545 [Leptomonas pyrrhocoris]|eukprot:XP_015664780.1 hypothetical protein ABB37_00545 [Leptomonas pyrrhocoris]
MDVLHSQNVPCLALVLGDEEALNSLQDSFSAFPHGVTYAQFRRLLLSYLHGDAEFEAGNDAASSPYSSLPASSDALHLPSPSSFPRTASPLEASATPGVARTSGSSAGTSSSCTASGMHVLEGQDTNREEARLRRVRTRQELAGVCATPVDPLKQLFNRIDVRNEQRVTWDDLLDYVVAEAGAGAAEARYGATRTRIYSFARALQCPPKQRCPTSTSPSAQQRGSSVASTSVKSLTYKRFCRDVHGARTARTRTKTDNGSSITIRTEEDLSLIRILDGLESHNAVFFVSSRSYPFLLYGKESLERVFTAPPDMLGGSVPTAVSYLAELDLFLCYSTDDRLLRGWYCLLAQSIATVAVTPLLIEGFVRRMRVMPICSPTYADYAESVFLGDSYGHVMHVTAPRGRCGGMAFEMQRIYKGLHSRSSGGLVDFCVYGSQLYSSGFDGRVVATSLLTGQSSEIGCVVHQHLHALVYVPAHNGLVAATSGSRQLLWWEAGSQSALPGVAFDHAGYGDHTAAIVAVVYVVESDYVASADCDGVVKVWEMATHHCVQSFQSSRTSGDDASGSGGSGEAAPATTLKSRSRAKSISESMDGFSASAGRDMMMLTHNGLHSLLSESAGTHNVGGAQCHALVYCAETEELMCGFANAITCRGLRGNRSPYVCDAVEVCQDVLYDVRNHTFLLRSATRLGVWDGVTGVRRGLLDRTTVKNTSHAKADIKAVCLDDLGSRVFLSAGDGNVYAYSTQGLAAEAGGDDDESLHLWNAATFEVGPDGSRTPVFVEKMHFSSTLRTWIAITSGGMLLVRNEADSQQTVAAATFTVSSVALTHMRVAEELGLVAVVDAEHRVYLYDMEAWTDAPETRSLVQYGRIVDLTFLEAAPVLVTVHAGGVCRCWSCPPAVECFELLGTIYHPQLPPPAASEEETLYDITRPGSSTSGAGGLSSAKLSGSMSASGDVAACMATQPANASLSRTPSARLLTAPFRDGNSSFSRKNASRHPVAKAGTDELTDSKSGAVAGPGHTNDQQPSANGSYTWANNTVDFGHASCPDARDHQSVAPETLIKNSVARTPTLLREEKEFTAVGYDGQSHHLFLGDTKGVVHVYRVCEMLQRYRLPRCSYAARPAFSLFAAGRLNSTDRENKDGEEGGKGEAPVHTPCDPVRLRSVEVHDLHRDRTVPRKRNLSLVAAARLPQHQLQSKSKPHSEAAGSVVCVRWLSNRGVLATSGNDHEVWLLNAEGDKLGFLSEERLPPRPRNTPSTTPSPPLRDMPGSESLAMSLSHGKSARPDDALPLQRPFFLSPTQAAVATANVFAGPPPSTGVLPCCTHSNLSRDTLTTNTSHFLPLQPKDDDGGVTSATATAVRGNVAEVRADKWDAISLQPQPVAGDPPHPPRPACELADYLTLTNLKTPLENPKSDRRAGEGGTVAANNTTPNSSQRNSSSFPAAFLSSKPLPLPQATEKKPVRRTSKPPRFTKSGYAVPSVQAADADQQRGPHRATDDAVADNDANASPSVANVVEGPLLPSGQRLCSPSLQHESVREGAEGDACSRISCNTDAPTLPNATVLPTHVYFPSNIRRASPPVTPTKPTEADNGTCESPLCMVTGVAFRQPSTRQGQQEDTAYSPRIAAENDPSAFFTRIVPQRGPPALTSVLGPKTTGDAASRGRFGAPEKGRFVSPPGAARMGAMNLPTRLAAPEYAAPPKGTAAQDLPMLAYTSPGEENETLGLYSRELQQRLRRPRGSDT